MKKKERSGQKRNARETSGPALTRETAELAVPEASKYGLQIIQVLLLDLDKVDAAHTRKLLDKYAIEPMAS